MAQLIDKSALVAEIKRRIKSANNDVNIGAIESLIISKTLNGFKSFIDTLEVIEIGVDIGSPEGDIGVKTIWDGDKIVSNKAQKGE